MKYFDYDVARDYVFWKLENGIDIDDTDLSITECQDTKSAIEAMERETVLPDDNNRRILRYMVLSELKSEGENLLHEIETVYADFDYPEDMESFIYYMPRPTEASEGDPVQALISRFRQFLDAEAETVRKI